MKNITLLLLIFIVSCSSQWLEKKEIPKKVPEKVPEVSYPVWWDIPTNISVVWKNNNLEIKNLMDEINCDTWWHTLPEMNVYIPDGFKYGMVTIQTKNEEWWTYWNWIAYDIPFWNHPFKKWLDEFPNGTLQAINSSGKKKFHLKCPKKWEKFEYKFSICGYSTPIWWIDDHTKSDDVINFITNKCREWWSSSYFWYK